MWIFTTIGFLSAVEDRQTPGNMLVRFRDPGHAAAFVAAAYAGRSGRRAQIRETPPPADYRWKVSITRHRFVETIAALADGIDYNNFKSACHRQRPDPYPGHSTMEIWTTMHRHQCRVVEQMENAPRAKAPPAPERELFQNWEDPDPVPCPECAGLDVRMALNQRDHECMTCGNAWTMEFETP